MLHYLGDAVFIKYSCDPYKDTDKIQVAWSSGCLVARFQFS